MIVIGGAEFIRYVTHGLQEALESKGKTMEHNDWMVLAIPTNLYPKPSWKAEDLMQVRLDTFKEEDDAEVLNIYQVCNIISSTYSVKLRRYFSVSHPPTEHVSFL